MKLNGDMLRDGREAMGLNQRAAADAMSISNQTLNRAETGDDVSPATAKTICDFLGIDLAKVAIPRTDQSEANDAA